MCVGLLGSSAQSKSEYGVKSGLKASSLVMLIGGSSIVTLASSALCGFALKTTYECDMNPELGLITTGSITVAVASGAIAVISGFLTKCFWNDLKKLNKKVKKES